MSTQSNPISQKLHEIKLSEFLKGQEVVTVTENDTVETVIRLLNKHGIHSCPVLSESGQCVGVIDMLAIMKHVVAIAPAQEGATPYNLSVASRAISWKKIGDLLVEQNVSFIPLEVDEFANLALDVFGSGVHRSPVLNSEGKVVETVSQSDFVRWLHNQSETYLKNMEVWESRLTDLGLGSSEVVSVRDTDLVINVIRTMSEQELTAVPIVNENGQLVGNFSATDLKAMCQENWPSFFIPVSQYLAEHSPTSLMSIGMSLDFATLNTALKYFNDYPQHRVWILENEKPVGVVTHTDILQFVRNYEYGVTAA